MSSFLICSGDMLFLLVGVCDKVTFYFVRVKWVMRACVFACVYSPIASVDIL